MFDKLIESDSVGADFKNRRNYFMVSSLIVGILFATAVVISIYAADVGLGNNDFELSTLVAPPMPEIVPEPPQSKSPTQQTQSQSELPSRQSNMLRPDETPIDTPPISVTPNTQMSRPEDLRFKIGPTDTNPPPNGDPGTAKDPGTGSSTEVSNSNDRETAVVVDTPPAKDPPPVRIKSIGVVNGIATSLPKPPYPPSAIALNIQGKVDVQVTIDETGKVISAKAASGHPFLKAAAEKAAWSARFTPTKLSNVPVKVTGVIVYNFTRN